MVRIYLVAAARLQLHRDHLDMRQIVQTIQLQNWRSPEMQSYRFRTGWEKDNCCVNLCRSSLPPQSTEPWEEV